MAQATIELRKILKANNFKLFDFSYPVISPSWKTDFEKSFVEFYYNYEIGFETPDMFKQRLKAKLNLIMPRYIEDFNKQTLITNPLMLEKTTRELTSGQNLNKDKTVTTSADITSDTTLTDYPQYSTIESDIPSTKSKDKTGSSGSARELDTTYKQEDVSEVTTKLGGLKEIKEYLKLQQNYTEQIIQECKTLFLLVY